MTKHSKPADAWNPWSTYIDAREEARRRGDRKVGTEHLILGLLREPVLAQALGCDLQTARDALDAMDHAALAAVGIGAAFNAPPIPIDETIKRPSRLDPAMVALAGSRSKHNTFINDTCSQDSSGGIEESDTSWSPPPPATGAPNRPRA